MFPSENKTKMYLLGRIHDWYLKGFGPEIHISNLVFDKLLKEKKKKIEKPNRSPTYQINNKIELGFLVNGQGYWGNWM